MEKALQRERSKHQSELSALEDGMKENFVMEMEIEKQKHQQMLDKVTSELKTEVTKVSESQVDIWYVIVCMLSLLPALGQHQITGIEFE